MGFISCKNDGSYAIGFNNKKRPIATDATGLNKVILFQLTLETSLIWV